MHAEHVLFVVELQIHILSFLDAKNLLNAALVCKQWSRVALDLLWNILHDLRPLISLLAPVATKRTLTLRGTHFLAVRHCPTSSANA